MSNDQTVARAGVEINVKGNVKDTLSAYSRQLTSVSKKVKALKTEFALMDAESLKGLNKQTVELAKYLGGLKGTVSVQREAAKLTEQGLKNDTQRQKLQTETLKTQTVQAQLQQKQESHVIRMGAFQDRAQAMQRRADSDALTAAARKEAAELRLLRLQERRAKETHELTADEERIIHLKERAASIVSSGNRMGQYQAVSRFGFGMAGKIAGLGHDHDVEHAVREQMSLEQMNLDATQGAGSTARALAGAERMRRMVGGLDVASSTDLVKDLINITGKVSEATNDTLMKRFAQFSVANQTAYGLTQGQSYNALKAAELLMPNRKGMTDEQRVAGMTDKMELINKAMAGTGNKVNPNEIYSFVKTAQSARNSLTDEGLIKLLPLMQEMGGSRTGTALMSVLQNLANGRASHASMTNLLDLGLLNKTVDGRTALEYDKQGRVKRMLPGAIKGDDLLRSDPVKWIETYLMPKTKGMDATHVDRLVNSIMGNRTAAGFVSTVLTQDARINKDASVIRGSKGIGASDAAQQGNYLRAERNYEAALATLRQRLGTAILPTLTRFIHGFTAALDGLNAFLANHPTLAKLGMGGALAGSTALGVAGAVGTVKTGIGIANKLGIGEKLGVGAGRLLAPLAEGAMGALEAIEAVSAAIPGLGWIVAGVTATIIGGIAAWKTNFLGFRSVAVGVGHVIHAEWVRVTRAIGSAFTWVVNKIKGLFSGLGGTIAKVVPDWLKNFLSSGAAGLGILNREAQQAASNFEKTAAADDAAASAPAPGGVHVAKVDIHVHGAGDPHKAAKETRRALHSLPTHPALSHAPAR